MGLHPAFAAGEAPRTDLRKLLAKAESRWWNPLVGRPVGSAHWWAPPLATVFSQEASWWVPTALALA